MEGVGPPGRPPPELWPHPHPHVALAESSLGQGPGQETLSQGWFLTAWAGGGPEGSLEQVREEEL